MRIAATALLLSALGCGLAGCGWRLNDKPKRDESAELRADFAREKAELFRQLRHENRDQIQPFYSNAAKFFQEGSDAYFIIGYEYYSLAKVLKENGQAEKAQDCFVKAKLYQDLSRTMRDSAEAARQQAQAGAGGVASELVAPPAIAPASRPAAAAVPPRVE